MWHSLPDGAAPPLGASARLWLSKARRKSVHCEGMPTSRCICSPGIRFQLAFELGKQKALKQRGRRDELSLPSASPRSPWCSPVCYFGSSGGWKGSLHLGDVVPHFILRAAVFPRERGAAVKPVSLSRERLPGENREKTHTHTHRKAIKSNFLPKECCFISSLNCKFNTQYDSIGNQRCIPSSTQTWDPTKQPLGFSSRLHLVLPVA